MTDKAADKTPATAPDTATSADAPPAMVRVGYGGPSGSLLAAEGWTVVRGASAHWPADVAERVRRALPDHSISVDPVADEDQPAAVPATPARATTSDTPGTTGENSPDAADPPVVP